MGHRGASAASHAARRALRQGAFAALAVVAVLAGCRPQQAPPTAPTHPPEPLDVEAFLLGGATARVTVEDDGRQAEVDLGDGTTMVLLRVPAGQYVRGSRPGEPGRQDAYEAPHPVVLSHDFWLGETPVTRGQFARFVEETGFVTLGEKEGWAYGWGGEDWGRVEGATWRDPSLPQDDDHPVISVAWADAVAFCEWAATISGLPLALPSEAQWEYAARAGTTTVWFWGNDPAGGEGFANVCDAAAHRAHGLARPFPFDDGFVYTSPVRSFRPNPWGFHDMTGNVWEWTRDVMREYQVPSLGGAMHDPEVTTPAHAAEPRVIRGGSWGIPFDATRSASRGYHNPTDRVVGLGFRVGTGYAAK